MMLVQEPEIDKMSEDNILTDLKAEQELSQKIESLLKETKYTDKILGYIKKSKTDSSFVMKLAEQKMNEVVESEEELTSEDENEDANAEKMNNPARIERLAIGNYFYLTYVQELCPDKIVMVYSPIHTFKVQLPFIMDMLGKNIQNQFLIRKGLLLAQKLIRQINEPLNSMFITEEPYSTFVQKLTQIIIYAESKSNRQLGLSILKLYFLKHDPEGKYLYFQFIMAKVKHTGLIGYMITLVKECIATALDEDQKDLRAQFLGSNFSKLISQVCVLKDGAKTDLLDCIDQVIAVLNLIRYLLIRDGTENVSGIMNEMPKIENEMLKPLRFVIDITKAQGNMKLKEITRPDYTNPPKEINSGDVETSISIGGKEVDMEDNLSTLEDQIKSIKFGLTSIDMLESVFVRVNECYSNLKT